MNFSAAMIIIGFAIPCLMGGYNLLTNNESAHRIMPIAAAMSLFSLPAGTLIAIYYYWFWRYKCGSPSPFKSVGKPRVVERRAKAIKQTPEPTIQQELIARVSALDGKQHEVNSNRLTLRATVDALSECTNVDRDTITRIADQLSVLPENLTTNDDRLITRNDRYAKYICITIAVLFCLSMFRWFNVSGNIKTVLHETSSLQSRIGDYKLRTGRYPYSFEQIFHHDGITEYTKSVQMGPEGQLLIQTDGLFGAEILLTPNAKNGWPQWNCTTDASLMFVVTNWVCRYGSTQFKA